MIPAFIYPFSFEGMGQICYCMCVSPSTTAQSRPKTFQSYIDDPLCKRNAYTGYMSLRTRSTGYLLSISHTSNGGRAKSRPLIRERVQLVWPIGGKCLMISREGMARQWEKMSGSLPCSHYDIMAINLSLSVLFATCPIKLQCFVPPEA